MDSPDPRRNSYHETPQERRLSREDDIQQVLTLLEKAVIDAQDETIRSRTKRLVLIQGDAGIGKTWFMGRLREAIKTQYPHWFLAPETLQPFKAEDFIGATPYPSFLTVLQSCDRALNIQCLYALAVPVQGTLEQVSEWAAQLEDNLNKRQMTPLVLFFDDLERWIGEAQKEVVYRFYRVVWQMLLRQTQLPCLIIGAARRAPPFYNPSLRLALTTYRLSGFSAEQLEKLVQHSPVAQLRPFIQHNAQGNPWVTQLLDGALSPQPNVLDAQQKEEIRKQIFEKVVSNGLEPDLKAVLYQLIKQRPNGFQPEDKLLPEGHTTLNRLIDASFVDFNEATRHYVVTSVLVELFKEENL
ncbi:MAG: ATP-binding protein [Caldilineaceae bacterium]